MFNKTILMLIFMVILKCEIQAQSPLQINWAFIQIELDSSSSATLPPQADSAALASQAFCVKVHATFSDTANIDMVHIKVGRHAGGHDVANVSIPYSGGTIPSSIDSFIKNQTGFLSCVAPSVHNAYTLYLEIWADDKSGGTTAVYSMHIN